MRYERRCNKDGSNVYYSFVTSDRKRLTKEQIRKRFGRDITTEEDAEKCLKLLEAQYEVEKIRIEERLAWEKKYYNHASLLEKYLEKQKKSAPNSWKNNEFYLKHYVLHYFLQIKKLDNIEVWVDHYDAFTKWLETAQGVKSKRPIAVNSRNHAIKALNTFMEHLHDANLISKYKKCETFGQHLTNERSIDDVVHPDEMERIYKRLVDNGHIEESVYFRYLYFSGMRFNEGLCLSLGDLFQGEIESDILKKKLKAYDYAYFGYIVSDGQFGGMTADNRVIRLPFKGKKKIEEKYNRIIPIGDKELWNKLIDIAEEKHAKMKRGTNPRDVLLFSHLDDTTASKRLQLAFAEEKLKWRPWHCLRHSRATWLIGETGDVMLARLWLGHTSPKTIEKYNHIYQAITRAARALSQTGKTFGLKRV